MTSSSTPGPAAVPPAAAATGPKVLTLYRDRHRIVSARDYDEDTGRMVDVCEHDGIRLYAQRGRWIHDRGVIRDLIALENGAVIRW